MTNSDAWTVHSGVNPVMTLTMERSDPAGRSRWDAIGGCFRRLAAGDREALAELYDEAAGDLFGLALWLTRSRDDAADAVQEVFVRLAAAGPRLARVRRPRPYLLAMARSAALDRLRAGRREEPAGDPLLAAAPCDPAAAVDAATASRRLARLPRPQREALYLRYFADLTFTEIGRVTGTSTFTAASRCRLGLRRLRRQLGAGR